MASSSLGGKHLSSPLHSHSNTLTLLFLRLQTDLPTPLPAPSLSLTGAGSMRPRPAEGVVTHPLLLAVALGPKEAVRN